jgi:hypothetical protein
MNLCNLLEVLPGSRLTSDLAEQWTKGTDEPFELHVINPEFSRLEIPDATPGEDLSECLSVWAYRRQSYET